MKNKINFLTLYQDLFKVLSSGNMQKLMEVSHDIIGVPILAVDIMYNLLGACPQKQTGDYYWDYLLKHKGYGTDMTVRLYTDGIMQSVNENEAPYIVDWGAATEDFPKILGVIKVNHIVEGYVVMQCQKDQITEERMQAMSIIQDACSLLMKDIDSESSMELAYQKAFINELFNNRIHSQKQLDVWRKGTEFFPEPPYRVITVSTNTSSEKNVLSYISKTIQQSFSRQLLLIKHNTLFILNYNLKTDYDNFPMEKAFRFLTKFNAYCGISNSFHDLLQIADYQAQAVDAMMIGKELDSSIRIYFYKDYYLPSILLPRIKQMPKTNYLSPIITQLQQYDAKHSTDFLDTLKVYINNLCSTSDSADELHIHRNSLLYRINKIEELTNCCLKDYETFLHLIISFYMNDLT